MLKKIISIVLLFIMLLQVLPLQQVGHMLFINQINEELPHNSDDSKAPEKKFTAFDDQFLFLCNPYQLLSVFNKTASFICYACSIPSNHAGEIHTPPPDIA